MYQDEENRFVILIVGPTGVGKTYLSTLISKELSVEIISADSRQVYKYLDIGTAKPAKENLRQIPHHFISMLEPDQNYSAGQFGSEAQNVIKQILLRNNVPLVVGGSGLYIKALVEGLSVGEIRDEEVRDSLEKRLEREGSQALYEELFKMDEAAAIKIHPNNSKRIIRAIEVCLITGSKFSELNKKRVQKATFPVLKFGLNKMRSKLYEDINARVDNMFREGLVSEVASILEMGFNKNLNSLNSVGYKEVIEYLDGKIDFDTCIEKVKQNSRRYAKRQITWFKSDMKIRWFNVNDHNDYKIVSKEIIGVYSKITKSS